MEEKSNMTAERSLEIITQQLERSRQDVTKDTGLSLYVSGLCVMGIALLIGICVYFTNNAAFYLLYATLPILIYFADRYAKRNKPKVPASFVGTMVDKTWATFGIFAIAFFVFTFFYDSLMVRTESYEVFQRLKIEPFRVILLLMGMAITINGYILKSRWLIWCGIIGGIGGFAWESFYMTETIVAKFFPIQTATGISHLLAGIIIALFSFIGLTLPGMKLKNK
ncbi:MAG: hypothetical protein IJ064_08105 [Bacteroidaceae bacterium]|nr:hypothetical protein [Bacteroidaceae bacterium]